VRELMQYSCGRRAPGLSSVHGEAQTTVRLKNRGTAVAGSHDTRSDAENFYIDVRRELLENGKQIRGKAWHETVPRDNL